MKIVSTMGSGSLGREIDLDVLVNELENYLSRSIDANITSNGMVTIRLEEDGPAYTLYRSGTFQIRGASNKENLSKAAARFEEVLSEIGVEILGYEFNHLTSVFMEDLCQKLNLETLTIALGMENTEYEPEQFPGLIYRPSQFDVTLLVFSSGKVIVGGTTDRSQAESAIQHLEERITALGDT